MDVVSDTCQCFDCVYLLSFHLLQVGTEWEVIAAHDGTALGSMGVDVDEMESRLVTQYSNPQLDLEPRHYDVFYLQ